MIIGCRLDAANACCANGELSVLMVVPIAMKKLSSRQPQCTHFPVPSSYPKVADDPSMYCPNVRSIPFGPGPNLMMFVAPALRD